MNIKRFFAPDMRRAIQQVRSEHGPDAVILSSRSTDGGVEIIAAVDYDQDLLARMLPGLAGGAGTAAARRPAAAYAAIAEAEAADGGAAAAAADADAATDAAGHVAHAAADVFARAASDQDGAAAAAGWAQSGRVETPSREAGPASRPAAEPERPSEPPMRGHAAGADDDTARIDTVPALAAMQSELKLLKGMLREQFSRLTWADLNTFDPERALLQRKVEALELSPALVEVLVAEAEHREDPARAWRDVVFGIGRRLQVLREDPLDQGGVFALVGPTGVGKTTTIAKLAARHCLRYDRDSLALITIDNFRVGAQRQLDAFGAILGVPVRRAQTPEALETVLADVADRRLVLIDTAGMAPGDPRLEGCLRQLECAADVKRFLVLAATMQAGVMREAAERFGGRDLAGVVLTKLDEVRGLGPAVTVLIETGLPVAWLSEGQRVPEDLKLARVAYLLKWAAAAGAFEPEPDGGPGGGVPAAFRALAQGRAVHAAV